MIELSAFHVAADRLAYNAKSGGKVVQGSGELLDAVKEGKVTLSEIKRDQLPEELQKLKEHELRAALDEKSAKRTELQAKASELNKQREAFIAAEQKRLAASGKGDAFDTKVAEILREQAKKKASRIDEGRAGFSLPFVAAVYDRRRTGKIIGSAVIDRRYRSPHTHVCVDAAPARPLTHSPLRRLFDAIALPAHPATGARLLMKLPAHSLRSTLVALTALATFSHLRAADTPDTVTADALWGNPPKSVEFFNVKFLKESKKIILPTLYVRMMNWGRVSSVTQTSALQSMAGRRDSTVRDTKEIVAAVDNDLVQSVATELYADLAAKLRAAGYEVITHDEVKSNAILAALPLEKVDPKTGAVNESVNMGKVKFRYSKIAPAGMPVYDPPIQGPLWPMRNALKELGAHAMIVTYTFEPIVMEAESKRGISSNSAHAKATAQLRLASGYASFLNNKMAGGSIHAKEPRRLTDNVGDIVPMADVSPTTANALSAGLGSLFGGGSINSRKNLLAMEPNKDLLRVYMLAGGKAFNDVVARSLAEQANSGK